MTQEDATTIGDGSTSAPPRVALLGSAAQRWFTARKWRADPLPGSEPFRVFADEVNVSSFTVRRVWHTAAVLTPTTPLADSPLPGVILQVEGSLTVDASASLPATLSSGGAALVPPGVLPAYSSLQSTARIEVRARPRLATAQLGRGLLTSDTPTSSWRLLANTVNTLLNGEVDPDGDSFTGVQSAIEYLASAVILEIAPGAASADDGASTTSFARLRARSERVIHRNADSAAFTVAALAEELGVSRSYLARAYANTDSTPSERIREVRLELAAGAASDTRSETRAALAGFSSPRAFRRAARAAGTRLSTNR